ncbi:MAG: hypothetical protein ACJ71W_11975 [Terriglobales bacterium]
MGYFAALSGTVLAYQKLEEPLKGTPPWLRPALVLLPLFFVFFVHTLPTLLDSYRRRRLGEIKGDMKPGYFRLSPREDVDGFGRVDNKHQEVLDWLLKAQSPVLYLTGLSGSGKSSLLSAWVLPKLSQQDPPMLSFKLRGFQDPAAQLERELRTPGAIWQRPPVVEGGLRDLLERACKQIKPQKLLVVLDQFEEFLILQERLDRGRFEALLNFLIQEPIEGLTVLLVLRSDYVGLLEELDVPRLVQTRNWKDIPPFTESAAYRFIVGSGLTINDELLRKVLREAAEVEQTKGLVRPVTINLCGLVLERFQGGLPRGFRPGALLRGFLREAIFLPQIKEVSPKVLPLLTSHNLTKKPGTVSGLAREAKIPESAVRGCLRLLGMPERGIVRAIDEEEETWEISHDFLVPLLDSVLAHRRISFIRRLRPWVPWLSAAAILVALPVFYQISAKEVAIARQVERSLHPITDVQISYELEIPIDALEMASYRERLGAGVKAYVARWPKQTGNIDATLRDSATYNTKDALAASFLDDGSISSVGIPSESKLMPTRDEVVAYYLLRFTGVEFVFYKHPVDLNKPIPFNSFVNRLIPLDSTDAKNMKPDLAFHAGATFAEKGSWSYSAKYDLKSGGFNILVVGIIPPKESWSSGGGIVAIPDLAESQLLLQAENVMFPRAKGPANDTSKSIKRLRERLKIRTITMRIGAQSFRLASEKFHCIPQTEAMPFCSFVFPKNLDDVRK